ncbi:MAG TPA: hypothetical protein VD994_19595 [Prosthecobacter sp.]|nr:hypothetical protein [Prosthecobacter sp.]
MSSHFILALSILAFAQTLRGEQPTVPLAKKQTLLLVDDADILYRAGTERVFHPATRHPGGPVIREEHPWEKAIAWVTVHRDSKSGRYQMWYQAYAGKGTHPKTHDCTVCYAESADGITFSKPLLGLHQFQDIIKTNIVLIGNGGYGDRYGCSVLVDSHEPDPAKRYKMAYYDWSEEDGREYAGLHLAFSPDGIHWTKHPKLIYRTAYGARGMQPPVSGEETYFETPRKDGSARKTWIIPGTMSDAMDVMFDPKRKKFAIYGKMWMDAPDGSMGWKHGMGRIESADLITWTRPLMVAAPDEFDAPMTEFHTTPAFYHSGRYFALNQLLDRRREGGIDIELMISRDGLDWRRPFRSERFLKRGNPSDFDSGSLFSNATPVILRDEIRFYYGAYSSTAVGGGSAIEGKEQSSGVGLATLPRDRFAGLRTVALSNQPTLKKPLEHTGQVTFKPLEYTGCKEILINAAAAGGSACGEILTEEGYRVPGFDKASCLPLKKDAIRFRLQWKDRKLESLPPGRYLLRIHLQRAELFAVTFR